MLSSLIFELPGDPAPTWYSLFQLYFVLGAAIGSVVLGLMFYFIYKYRDGKSNEPEDIKPGRIPGERSNVKIILGFFSFTAIVLFSLAIYSIPLTNYIEDVPQGEDVIVIEVIGYQWGWRFIYPNGTESVGEVRVPAGKTIVFKITSLDVLHNFKIKDFRVGVDAVPGAYTYVWIRPHQSGEYLIQCYELCGVGHANMVATLIVG